MSLVRDLRIALRILRRQPSYAWSAIAVMALGVAAVSAVLSVLQGVLLTPLPYREPGRVVLLRADAPGFSRQALLTPAEFAALRDRIDLFASVAAIVGTSANLTTPGDMAPLTAAAMSDNFLDTLGVAPVLGRSVAAGDGSRAVNISHGLWQRRFQGDPGILGRQIDVNNRPATVVGVLPASFKLHLGPGVHVPSSVDVFYLRGRGYDEDPVRGNVVIARLKTGVTPAAAAAAVDAMTESLAAATPVGFQGAPARLSLTTIDREVASQVRPALLAIAGAVAFVLLAACANLANLLVARVAGRGRELAIRASIGASRPQLVRQFLAEGLVIGALGATGGVLLAQWAVDVLIQFAPAALPRRDEIVFDPRVAAVAVAVSLLSAMVVSALPLWHAIRSETATRVKQDARNWQNARVTRGGLIAAQLALSLILLAGFGVVARAFVNLRAVPLGFEPRGAATLSVSLDGQRFNAGTLDEARLGRLAFYQQLRSAARDLPGVQQFGAGFPLPMSGMSMVQPFVVEPGQPQRMADGVIALAGYLEALQVPLVEGRYFSTEDDNRPVIIIDDSLASELWPSQSAIGRQLEIVTISGSLKREVIGVVGHVQFQGLRQAGMPQIWMTYATRTYSQLNAVVRAETPLPLVSGIGREAQRLGSGRPIRDPQLLAEAVANASADTRFAVLVLGVFGALALLLAVVGVYGVVSNALVRRTREIAVRIALGAEASRILGLAIRETAAWTAAGLMAGIAGALLLTRYLETLLFQVTPTDAITFAIAAGFLGIVAVAAAAIPAVRASRVDPMLAMRAD